MFLQLEKSNAYTVSKSCTFQEMKFIIFTTVIAFILEDYGVRIMFYLCTSCRSFISEILISIRTFLDIPSQTDRPMLGKFTKTPTRDPITIRKIAHISVFNIANLCFLHVVDVANRRVQEVRAGMGECGRYCHQ